MAQHWISQKWPVLCLLVCFCFNGMYSASPCNLSLLQCIKLPRLDSTLHLQKKCTACYEGIEHLHVNKTDSVLLQVCKWKLGRYPEIVGFLSRHDSRYSKLRIEACFTVVHWQMLCPKISIISKQTWSGTRTHQDHSSKRPQLQKWSMINQVN